MSWPEVKLSEVIEYIRGVTFKPSQKMEPYSEGSVVCFTTANVQKKLDITKLTAIEETVVKRDERFIKSGDLLISSANSWELVGKTVHVPDLKYKATAGGFIGIIRPTNIDSRYLYYWITSDESQLKIRHLGRQTTNISNLSIPRFLNLKIPLPSISEQKKIAAILDKADEIKQASENVTTMRQQLLLSTFYEMFHSDRSVRSNWPVMRIEELALQRKNSMRTGPFGSNLLHSEFVDEGIPVLGIDNVVDNVFKWKKERYITEEKYRSLERYTVFPGDLLVTIMGTVGRTAVCPDDLPVCINTKHLACITLNQELVHPSFVSYSLRHDQEILMQIQLKNRGAIMDGLNLTLIKSLNMCIPPIELQRQFVEIMNRILDLDEQIEYANNTTLSLTQELIG